MTSQQQRAPRRRGRARQGGLRARPYRPFTPEQLAARVAAIPVISFPDLPVSARRHQIADAIRGHQVVIVSGETGSGKTTQIPKICLQLGRGVRGMIGHTQPRRIAARSVAERIAEELGQTAGHAYGQIVGYQMRFTDEVGPTTLVKLMTDGILLSEIQTDPLLRRYDTLIIDEAHERSLNIDFILGYLARLLPARPDLKVIITSATIDSERFARHFGRWEGVPERGRLIEPAPVIEVSGRTYPVEIRYRPLAPDVPHTYHSGQGKPGGAGGSAHEDAGGEADQAAGRQPAPHADRVQQLVLEDPDGELPTQGYGKGEPIDQEDAICAAVDELAAEGPGDVLVFLPGERDIRDTAQALADHLGPRYVEPGGAARGHRPDAIEVVPLFARLSAAEQHRIFEPHALRRIVLATNIAETSLTVPGIRYVVDPGLARISRFSTRTKVQRLPIEPVSQASANQRAGRCGRVADGIAIRLYSQADYEQRPEFTEPEILRTSLASVILQMAALGLGDVAAFPFLDPPNPRAVRDGTQLLVEIGALDAPRPGEPASAYRLSHIGRELAGLPMDPRLGRMLIEGQRNGCASDVLVIVAALSIQDVRERPLEHQAEADRAHARFTDPSSDFITYLNLWRYLGVQRRDLSGSRFRRMCRGEFLHYLRWREWVDVVHQLRGMARDLGVDARPLGLPSSAQVIAEAKRAGIADAAARAAVAYTTSASTPDADDIHRSLLVGLLSNVGSWDPAKKDYQGTRGTRFVVWPGSGLARAHHPWVMTAELVETSRLFARTVARIRVEWVERLGAHLLRRVHSAPYWSSAQGAAMIHEKVLLYGLTLVADRPVLLARLGDAAVERESAAPVESAATRARHLAAQQGREDAGGDAATTPSGAMADALAQALAQLGLSAGAGAAPPRPAGAAPAGPSAGRPVAPDGDGSAASALVAHAQAPDAPQTARELARELFVRHALVHGEWRGRHRFQERNAELLDRAREAERRSRTHGLVADEQAIFRFYEERVPDDVVSQRTFERWWRDEREAHPDLLTLTPGVLLPRGSADPSRYPGTWVQGDLRLRLSYVFDPDSPRDGVTVRVPIEVLPRVREEGFDWLVPGMLDELCTESIRALPRALRRMLAPAPDVGAQVAAWIRAHAQEGEGDGVTRHEDARGRPAAPAPLASGGADDPHSLTASLDRLAAWGASSGRVRADRRLESREPPPSAPAPARPRREGGVARGTTPGQGTSGGRHHAEAPPHRRGAERPSFARAFADALRALRGVDVTPAAWARAEQHLPEHLRMHFQVVDGRGREIGAGPSLTYLQTHLSRQADRAVRTAVRGAVAQAMADAVRRAGASEPADAAVREKADDDGPHQAAREEGPDASVLDADGLDDFPQAPLPRHVESHRGRMLLRAYPGLIPQGSDADPRAGVRASARAEDSDRQHRLGLIQLLVRRVRLSTARVTTRWSGRRALALAASPYPSTDALVADLQRASVAALVDELTGAAGPSGVRDRAAFEALAARVRERHEDRVYQYAGFAAQALAAQAEVERALGEHPQPSLADVARDVRRHTRELVGPGFVARTPAFALPHLPRYLRAGAERIRRATASPGALSRDRHSAERIAQVEAAVAAARRNVEARPFDPVACERLVEARWMIEELRVSLFAQRLGTAQKVSAKRILGMVA